MTTKWTDPQTTQTETSQAIARWSTKTKVLTGLAIVLILAVIAFAVTGLHPSNKHVPAADNQPAVAATSSSAAPTAPVTSAAPAAPSSATAVGKGYGSQDSTDAINAATVVLEKAQQGHLAADLVEQTPAQRVALFASGLSADAQAFLVDPKNMTVPADGTAPMQISEAFTFDPAGDKGEKFISYQGMRMQPGTTPAARVSTEGTVDVKIATVVEMTTTEGAFTVNKEYDLSMVNPGSGWVVDKVISVSTHKPVKVGA